MCLDYINEIWYKFGDMLQHDECVLEFKMMEVQQFTLKKLLKKYQRVCIGKINAGGRVKKN